MIFVKKHPGRSQRLFLWRKRVIDVLKVTGQINRGVGLFGFSECGKKNFYIK